MEGGANGGSRLVQPQSKCTTMNTTIGPRQYTVAEAASGGAIGLVQEGDRIEIDIPNRSINVAVSENEFARRRTEMESRGKQAWKPVAVRPRKVSVALRAYAAMVTSADKGAVRDVTQVE